MKISSVNLYSNNFYNKLVNNTEPAFSAHSEKKTDNISDNMKKGLTVAKKLMKHARTDYLTLPSIHLALNASPLVPIFVRPVKDLPGMINQNMSGKILAHMLPKYNYNFQLAEAEIYLPENVSTAKEKGELIANTAHEYTHVLQRSNDKSYYGILDYTKEPREVIAIARTAQSIMQNTLRNYGSQIFGSPIQNSKVINARLQNKYNVKDNLKPTIVDGLIDSASKVLSQQMRKDKNDIKKAITGWIKQESANEVEAYNVTLKAFDEWGKYDAEQKGKILINRDLHQYINEIL